MSNTTLVAQQFHTHARGRAGGRCHVAMETEAALTPGSFRDQSGQKRTFVIFSYLLACLFIV